MPKISTNKLKSGMTVAAEVVDRDAQVVIRNREILTEQHIALLKMWGIAEIEIVECSEEFSIDLLYSQYSKSMVDAVLQQAEVKFSLHSDDCAVSRLLQNIFVMEELRRRSI